jgi:hypothetical protein
MAQQLPHRMGDFQTFKLPTAAEWAALKKKLTRAEQIDYLCERLLLLNCFQMGQPGGYFPDEKQYAEPCGMARKHPGTADQVAPLKAWLQERLKEKWREGGVPGFRIAPTSGRE